MVLTLVGVGLLIVWSLGVFIPADRFARAADVCNLVEPADLRKLMTEPVKDADGVYRPGAPDSLGDTSSSCTWKPETQGPGPVRLLVVDMFVKSKDRRTPGDARAGEYVDENRESAKTRGDAYTEISGLGDEAFFTARDTRTGMVLARRANAVIVIRSTGVPVVKGEEGDTRDRRLLIAFARQLMANLDQSTR